MPLSCAALRGPLHRGIARAREAHVDHPHALGGCPFQAPEDVEGGALGAGRATREGVDRIEARGRRNAHQLAMGEDRARHAGAVRMGHVRRADRIELLGDHALKIGMLDVDLRIDDRHADIATLELAVDVDQAELADGVLGGIALALGQAGEVGLMPLRQGLPLRRHIGVVGLRPRHDLVGPQVIDHRRNRGTIVDVNPVAGDADQAQILRSKNRQAQERHDGLDPRIWNIGRDLQHDLVLDEVGFAERRRGEEPRPELRRQAPRRRWRPVSAMGRPRRARRLVERLGVDHLARGA
jgi:hypothetical protein